MTNDQLMDMVGNATTYRDLLEAWVAMEKFHYEQQADLRAEIAIVAKDIKRLEASRAACL